MVCCCCCCCCCCCWRLRACCGRMCIDSRAARAHGCVAAVFVVGYCMGGALALAAAVHTGKELSGAFPFYGIPGAQLADPAKVACPLQLHFGTADAMPQFSDAAVRTRARLVLGLAASFC